MGLLERIVPRAIERRTSPENPSTSLANPAAWLLDWAGGAQTSSGKSVNEFNALTLTTVYACVQVIAETLGTIPLVVYERLPGGGKRRAEEHPLFGLLHDAPNPDMSSVVFRETLTGHVATWGGGFAEILDRGRQLVLEPRLPDRTYPRRTASGGVAYFYDADKTGDPKRIRVILPQNMLHIPGWGWDGVKGYSRIHMARNAIGLGLSLEESGGRLFQNGIRGSAVVTHPGKLRPESARMISESISAAHAGSGNFFKPIVLEEGMTWEQIGIPPDDAQFLQSRQFQTIEIAAIFRMQLHKIQRMENATYSNIEQQAIEHVTDTIRPYCVRWEQELNRKLFNPVDRGRYFCEFNLEGLLRGDIKSRYDAYAVGRQWGWLSANDVRSLENLNPISDGDAYMAPMNMTTLAQLGKPQPGQAPPTTRTDARSEGELRTIRLRERLHTAQARMIAAAARRIINREVAQTKRAVSKYIGQRSAADFRAWAERWYNEHAAYVDRAMRPVLLSFAEQIAGAVAAELGQEPRDLTDFVRSYTAAFATRHAQSRLGELVRMLDETDLEDLASTISDSLERWQDTGPDRIAHRESVQGGGAFARMAYALGGVQILRWVTIGDNCPLCSELDGNVVAIHKNFVDRGQTLGLGTPRPLTADQNYAHPPIHRGCNCMITAG